MNPNPRECRPEDLPGAKKKGAGFRWINPAWDVEGLTPSEAHVLNALAKCADYPGECWPRRIVLMRLTRFKDFRTISEATKSLEHKGLISKVKRRGRASVYKLLFKPEDHPEK